MRYAAQIIAALAAEGINIHEVGEVVVVSRDDMAMPVSKPARLDGMFEAEPVPYPGQTRKSKSHKLERAKRIQALQNGAFNKKRR